MVIKYHINKYYLIFSNMLYILDDDDHIDKYFKKSSFSSKENIVPIPAGLSQSGYPYFAPPM